MMKMKPKERTAAIDVALKTVAPRQAVEPLSRANVR